MKIVAISDTHDQHRQIQIPECDVLIVAGDFTCHHDPIISNYQDFNEWLGDQPAKYRIVVAGNHDTLFERDNNRGREILSNAIYLHDSGTEIDGIKFWGSPWILPVSDWAFMLPEDELKKKWDLIPKDTDVLITHMPPWGILDKLTHNNQHVGSRTLAEITSKLNLDLHIFGHIHEEYGKNGIHYNVAQCDERNRLVNKPIVLEI